MAIVARMENPSFVFDALPGSTLSLNCASLGWATLTGRLPGRQSNGVTSRQFRVREA
jgi:hypothetical protein